MGALDLAAVNFTSMHRFWKQNEEEVLLDELPKKALLRVVRRHLTPPPSSTNVERLFSYAGLTVTDHRASLEFGRNPVPSGKCGDGQLHVGMVIHEWNVNFIYVE